jgi:hypothetical protein
LKLGAEQKNPVKKCLKLGVEQKTFGAIRRSNFALDPTQNRCKQKQEQRKYSPVGTINLPFNPSANRRF